MKITLEFTGTRENLQKAITSEDDSFDLVDSIFWEMDYGEGESIHSTEYGDVIIKYEE